MDAARVDFTSALYLGMRHPAEVLPSWPALTLGKPAELEEDGAARGLADSLARLMACEAACLLPSSLHLFWDLFGMLAREPLVLLVDAAAYPVARWGALRARGLGMPVATFRAGCITEAGRLAHQWRSRGRRPVLLADGYSPGSDTAPPLQAYAQVAREYGGWLLLDDTQALGVLGACGGGSVSLHGLQDERVLVGASLAKGFGVPLAVLAGPRGVVRRFLCASETRRHCSPPSAAALAAGRHAVALNMRCGAELRARLGERVAALRGGLRAAGIVCAGGRFPVQRVALGPEVDGRALHRRLGGQGIDVLLQRPGSGGGEALALLLRADHSAADIGRVLAAIHLMWEECHAA